MLFGDHDGNIILSDRNFKLIWKHKAFKGEVKGVSYIYNPINHQKQYVFAVGDEFVHHSGKDGGGIRDTFTSGGMPSVDSGAMISYDSEDSGSGDFHARNVQENFYMLKIFDVNDMSKPLHSFHASPGVAPTATITSFAVLGDGCQVAIGYSSGSLLLFSGNYIYNEGADAKSSGGGANAGHRMYLPDTVLLQRERLDRTYFPISSLHFYEVKSSNANTTTTTGGSSASQQQQQAQAQALAIARGGDASQIRKIRLFAVMDTTAAPPHGDPMSSPKKSPKGRHTLNSPTNNNGLLTDQLDSAGIIVFDTSLSGSISQPCTPALRRMPHAIDEDFGATKNCATFMSDTSELVVARNDGVFSYTSDDRGGAAGIEGVKQCVGCIGRYVLVASVDEKNTGGVNAPHSNMRTSITIYDLRSKIISLYVQLPAGDRVLHCLQDGSKY